MGGIAACSQGSVSPGCVMHVAMINAPSLNVVVFMCLKVLKLENSAMRRSMLPHSMLLFLCV